MPASARQAMSLKAGDKLVFNFNSVSKQATISKPLDIEELSAQLSSYIKPGTKLILNVDEYYQQNRSKAIR